MFCSCVISETSAKEIYNTGCAVCVMSFVAIHTFAIRDAVIEEYGRNCESTSYTYNCNWGTDFIKPKGLLVLK